MNKKPIRRIATVVMACASVSVFAFVGCGKPAEHTHTLGEWQSDETKHWHVCADCDVKIDEGNHTYDNPQDTDCNVCGYLRTVTTPEEEHTHTADTAWHTDENKHWYECASGDGAKLEEADHTYDGDQDTTCNACGYLRTVTPPEEEHTHTADTAWQKDATNHWHNCTANDGAQLDKAAHGYDNYQDTTCNTCGHVREVSQPEPEPPSTDYTTGIHTLTFAGDADIFTSSIATSNNDSGYNSTYFKVASGDYLYANMKLQKNKVIKVTGKAVTSNKTDSTKNTNLGVSLGDTSTGAVSGLPSPIAIAQADGEKTFSFECTVSSEGDIILAFTRDSGNTGCEITELKIEITDSAPVPVTGISLNKTTSSLTIGSTETLTAMQSTA